MYYLRTDVFSKQKEKLLQTVMESASNVNDTLASPTATVPVCSRSILSIVQRDKRHKLLHLFAATRETKSSPKLIRFNRLRAKLQYLPIRSKKLLCKFQLGKHNGFTKRWSLSVVPFTHASAEKGKSMRSVVSSCRGIVDRCSIKQVIAAAPSSDKLCTRSTSETSRRGTTGHCLSTVALERSLRSQRTSSYSQMSQRKRPNLRVLQSRTLESTMSTR